MTTLNERERELEHARRYPRIGLDGAGLSSEVWRNNTDVSEPVKGRLIVLGEGGAFLEITDRFSVGSEIKLRFELPGTENERIVCKGIVREHVEGEGIGVEFTGLEASDRKRLKSAVLHWAMSP